MITAKEVKKVARMQDQYKTGSVKRTSVARTTKITAVDRAKWLARKDTWIEFDYQWNGGPRKWRAYRRVPGGITFHVRSWNARTKTAAINAAIRAERK